MSTSHAVAFALGLAAALTWTSPARADEPEPNYLRPALEIGAGLAAASVWYAIDDRNVLDWDRPSIEQRFNGEAWRFDSNGFALNYVWHPLAGAGMYVLARGNGLGVAPSFGYSLAGSTLWEYVIEFNEKVSINDMLVTPLSGLVVGEFFHKLALHLSGPAPRTAGDAALAWTFGLSVHGHRRLDGIEVSQAPALFRDLRLGYGFGLTTGRGSAGGAHWVGFEGRFVSLPGYLEPRTASRWFGSADFASFDIEVGVGRDGAGADVFGETLLAGHHVQRLSPTSEGRSGLAVTSALSAAYAYRDTPLFGFDDRLGLLHVPGLALELHAFRGELAAFVGLRAAPSFGSMSSLGYRPWRRRETEGRSKTVLERESYFYGWGYHGALEARLGAGVFELQGALAYDRLDSIEGLDRAQERVTRDVHAREAGLSYRGTARVKASRLLDFGVTVERRKRRSRLSTSETTAHGERVMVQLAMPL